MRYCVGDVHGCLNTLKKLVARVLQNDYTPEFYFVGDLIDRGPDSKGVIDYLIELDKKGFSVNAVRGNHEQMFLETYNNNFPVINSNWFYNGAEDTIKSFSKFYNLNSSIKNIIPEYFFSYIKGLPYYIEIDGFLIVHAGFNFGSNDPFNDLEYMLWTRTEQNDNEFTNGKRIIHGHTPVPKEDIITRIKDKTKNVINIDSGCVYTKRNNLGVLTALNLDEMTLIHVRNID